MPAITLMGLKPLAEEIKNDFNSLETDAAQLRRKVARFKEAGDNHGWGNLEASSFTDWVAKTIPRSRRTATRMVLEAEGERKLGQFMESKDVKQLSGRALQVVANVPEEKVEAVVHEATARAVQEGDGKVTERIVRKVANEAKVPEKKVEEAPTKRCPLCRGKGYVAQNIGAFDEWWAVYPRPVAKGAAEKAFAAAMKDVGKSRLMTATKAWTIHCEGKDPKYIPHPATWLNRRSYLDDPSEWAKENQRANIPEEAL